MNVFVLLKQVPDTETKIKLTSDNSSIEKSDIKWIISPYDEYAVEEGLKTKEALKTGTVTALTAGPDRAVEALRTALAMGADNAIHVKLDESADTYVTAKALAEVLKKENPDLILAGKQAADSDQASLFGAVAEFLNQPSVTEANKIELGGDNKTAKVHREVEGGTKWIIEMPLPGVIAVTKGINTPRYASLPGIMKAKRKPVQAYTLAELGLDGLQPTTKESDYALPPERTAGKKIDGEPAQQAAELVRLLREEAKVI